MSESFDCIELVREADGLVTLYLNRPDKHNAMSFALLHELVRAAKLLRRDRSVRAVLIAGRGASFSAGIDLRDLSNPRHRVWAGWQLLKPTQSLFQRACLIWQTLPVPVVAVLHGHCFGAGMQLALAADVRVCTADCTLSIMEARWGLVPDMGLTRSLCGLVGLDVATYVTLSAAQMTGVAAHAYGLVTRVVDDEPMHTARAMAREMMQHSPDAVLAGKRVLHAMVHRPRWALWLEKWWQLKLIVGRNSRIAQRRGKNPNVPYEPRQYR